MCGSLAAFILEGILIITKIELNERGINLIENELLSKIVHFLTLGASGVVMGILCKKYDKKIMITLLK